ncbi:N-acetylmuramoyl-L-alanine amidase [Clostridioides difficile]|uniref:N-acetylmuramoyl-L-alanine amidase family protein n=1 Tax=Bacillota TaxID=1239 RepID=UPI001CC6C0FF|nr:MULTISPECIES: N-acetylmuramoyl-L-alanine amidase [Bacillota]MDB3083683.1 N-acetylmuramoyl-L-alanine amidase [Clostridioides difficile]MBZ6007629.1 N-acetylmuramoyl-L-alanine amidase [Paraclostridium bifermentans]MDU0296603.1 N-acetylmuramoyl-L-alanine amidase [Paraclostridium sp. MRS3W1]UOW69742.1 N-acetylmuramoyl-L-alanine amidase [Paraclostridium bifermentans]GJG92184.1 sporulation-specific N-acetylmuramoyl-L-alanine amidase [Enterococcus faecium]
MKKLVIDLGHGGSDPGAIGQAGTFEANVVLAIGKELNELLKGFDLDVKFTRLSDKFISLIERSKIANEFGADYFLSIHINSASDKSVRGVEVWEYSKGIEKLDNFSIGLCEDISKLFNIRNRGIKLSKELSVLKHTKMSAALVEVDFISNIEGEKALKDSNNIKAIALAIRNNLIKLFELEANTNLYKVCIGAYRDKNNAINQVKIAKEKGFVDAYII